MTWKKFNIECPQTLDATVQNVVARATLRLGFMHPCSSTLFTMIQSQGLYLVWVTGNIIKDNDTHKMSTMGRFKEIIFHESYGLYLTYTHQNFFD